MHHQVTSLASLLALTLALSCPLTPQISNAQTTEPALATQPATQPAPRLQFRLVRPADDTSPVDDLPDPTDVNETLPVLKDILLDESSLASAVLDLAPLSNGSPVATVTFSKTGGELFAKITRENVNQRLAILFDSKVLGAPMITAPVRGGCIQLAFPLGTSPDEAKKLAATLNTLAAKNPPATQPAH